MGEKELFDLEGMAFHSSTTYVLQQEIGRGGMGIVYLAEKHSEGVTDLVVLKTIKILSRQYMKMLKKEANIATNLRHENIVKTYGLEAIPVQELPKNFRDDLHGLEYSKLRQNPTKKQPVWSPNLRTKAKKMIDAKKASEQKLYLIAMDYIEGIDLGSLFRDHRRHALLVPPILTAFIISRICRALAYAHQRIIHRDISPENILIDDQGVSKLSDFGVAVGGKEQIKLLAGKLGYMAPEQLRDEKYDQRVDLFALGVVSYLLLTGVNLFATPLGLELEEQMEYVRQRHTESILPPHKMMKDIPKVLSTIIMKMLAPDPQNRYSSAEAACNDLEQRYMYAKGFGPTNNSMQAYIEIFQSKFQEYNKKQLQQLRFLTTEDGKMRLHRPICRENYTDEGLEVVRKFRGTRLHSILFG